MSEQHQTMESIGEIVRRTEDDYISGTTQISTYVNHSMSETLDRIDAYLFSKHISGETDSLGREKPFFNIITAAVNVWYRATDIDRKHIKIRGTKSADWINSFLATVKIWDWMRKARYGQFLNEWGRVLARYGGAVVKFVRNDEGLHISVIPWSRIIVDAVDFDAAPKVEIIELNEAQLRRRVETHGYYKEAVNSLIGAAKEARETTRGNNKDDKNDYYKLFEIHGDMSVWHLTKKDSDIDEYTQQMHVMSFVGIKQGRKIEFVDFTLVSGREEKDPYMMTKLIAEDGRTLPIGAVEHLFEAQWMENHSKKAVKDHLDIASRLLFQTSDSQFLGRNVMENIESGDIFVHAMNQPLTQLNNSSHDTTAWQNFSGEWKALGNEIVGVSDQMLGRTPHAGSAWRQTEAVLNESYNLFELMTENKGLDIDEMMRVHIIPYIKDTELSNADEISATLDEYQINRIDSRYVKNEATKRTNNQLADTLLQGGDISPQIQAQQTEDNTFAVQEGLSLSGNQRFFKPDEIDWATQFEDLEWDLEIDVTGEQKNIQEALTTLNTALQMVMNPNFGQNKQAQAIVGRTLELTGAMSPVEFNALPSQQTQQQPTAGKGGSKVEPVNLPESKERNIK